MSLFGRCPKAVAFQIPTVGVCLFGARSFHSGAGDADGDETESREPGSKSSSSVPKQRRGVCSLLSGSAATAYAQ